jgi:Subtilase family/Calx-beta domain
LPLFFKLNIIILNGENIFRAAFSAASTDFVGVLPVATPFPILPALPSISTPLIQIDLPVVLSDILVADPQLFWPQTQGITPDLSNIVSNQQARSLVGIDALLADVRFANLQGQSQTIAVIDTGINPQHSFFGVDADGNGVADRIIYQYDFADGDGNARAVNGHGSQTASIVASQDATLPGIAPEVNIVSLKVFNDSGESDYRYVKQALDWVTMHADRYRIGTVLMALGDNQNLGSADDRYQLGQTLSALADQGVIAVASAGNDFARLNSQQGLSAPANDPNVVAVGAVYNADLGRQEYGNGAIAYSTGVDRLTPFTQRNAQTVFAPGAPITGAGAIGNSLLTLQGSSQAAAYVAGAAVLAQQLADRYLGRSLNVNEFRQLVLSTGKDIRDGDDENDNVINTGLGLKRLDLFAMANQLWQQGNQGNEPQLSITTTQNLAWEKGEAGVVIVSRSGDVSQSLSFNYRLSGTAQNGQDYQSLSGGGLFVAGQATTEIKVVTIDDGLAESGETVVISLVDGEDYQLTKANSTRLAIVDNDSVIRTSATQVFTAPALLFETASPFLTPAVNRPAIALSLLPSIELTPITVATTIVLDPLLIDYAIVDADLALDWQVDQDWWSSLDIWGQLT